MTRSNLFFIICALGLFVPQFVNAQVRFAFSTGYGTYAMDELSELQMEVAKDFPLPGKTTTYPGYINFEGGVLYDFKIPLIVGITGGYGSSGARTYYGDYSGSIYFDQLATYKSIGVSVAYNHKFRKGFRMYIDLHPALTLTKLTISTHQNVGTQRESGSYEFESSNAGIEPTIGVLKKYGLLGISAYAGYNMNLTRGTLDYNERKDVYLVNDNGDAVKADWSGIRVGVGVSLYLWKDEKEQEKKK